MKNDLISRSAAIEAIEKHIRTAEEPYQLTDADKVMNHAFEIAASCIYNLSATEADVPDINDGDMISRQAVLKLLAAMPPEETITKAMLIQSVKQMSAAQPYTDEEIKKIQELEQAQFEKMYEFGYQAGRAAQPERQRGEWIDYTEDGYVECPFCHNATNCDGNKDELHFCFSCGADMREDNNETD